MRQTVVGVFDRYASAQRAVQVLQDSGFGPDAVHVTEGSEAARQADSAGEEADDLRGAEGITAKIRNFFSDLFGPDDDFEVSQYSDALRRGCAVVKVDVAEEARLDAAREALQNAGAIDIEEQAQGRLDMPASERSATGGAELRGAASDAGEQVVPVVREELHVGKRPVKMGGVRVYTRTEERPVEETVTLREERAQVERRPADREVTAADMNRAREQTIEVTETTEKPVVEKVARVVEEVVVGKDVQERTEQVRDTVRETKVEVEPLSGDAARRTAFDDRASDYRTDFDSRYAASGGRWEEYEPAYRYGHELRDDTRYAGRSWDEIEPDVRRDWESAHPGSAWDGFKAAVRHAWERVTT